MVHEAAVLLGSNILASLQSFIVTAEEGARLILQRNREGFTIQVTEPVERSTEEPLDIEGLKAWHEKLSATRRRA